MQNEKSFKRFSFYFTNEFKQVISKKQIQLAEETTGIDQIVVFFFKKKIIF